MKIQSFFARAVASITLVSFTSYLMAAPAVFFNADLTAGRNNFTNTLNTADAADTSATYTTFTLNLGTATSAVSSGRTYYTATSGGTSVYVVASRNGNNISSYNSQGYSTWSVGNSNWADAVTRGYKLEFYSDTALTSRKAINALGLEVFDWGTCCINNNITPTGTTLGTAVYMVLSDGTNTTTNLVGNYTGGGRGTFAGTLADGSSNNNSHFVAAIDDTRNTFNTISMVPNGDGEFFGAGGILYFSLVGVNTVPSGSSSVVLAGSSSAVDITASHGKTYADLGTDLNRTFAGGTLVVPSGSVNSDSFTVTAVAGNTIQVDTGGTATFSGNFTGAGGLSKSGAGTLIFSGSATKTYSGGTTVTAGTLSLASADVLSTSADLTVSGTGTLAIGANNNTVGNVVVSGGAITGTTGILTGSSYSVTNSTGTTLISAILAGTATLTKTGDGTLTLSANNTYTGNTAINGGTVSVTGSLADTTAVSVATGATYATKIKLLRRIQISISQLA